MKEMKKEKIYGTVAVSNHHCHLTKETYNLLFNDPICIKRPLNQIGEFAALQTVCLQGPTGEINRVRVVGPFRDYNQVEISRTDAQILGINPPVRQSGDLEDSETITLIGTAGEVTLDNVCIQAERHVHMNSKKAAELGLKNEDLVHLKVETDKGGTMEAFVKISDNGFYEIHLDKDDANSFMLKTGDIVEIEK